MWRTPEYKLILRMERKPDASTYTSTDIIGGEFYDLLQDPNEWVNLYGNKEIAGKQEQKTQALLAHLKLLKKLPPFEAGI